MNIKRIKFLALAMLMLVPALFCGCGPESNNNETNAANTASVRQNISLNMYVLTEEETTLEQARAVQMAINEITVPEYKTTIKINYLTEDKYWDAIEKQKAEVEAYKSGETVEEEEKTQEEVDAELNDLIDSVFEAEDITLDRPQLDIFMVNGEEKFAELVTNGEVVAMDTYLSLEEKIVNSYVYPTYLKAATYNTGSVYGIPVNRAIGEYEYFVFNKALLDKYGYSADDFKTFEDLRPFLASVRANEPGVIPLAKTTYPAGYHYFGGDGAALGTEKEDDGVFPDYMYLLWTNDTYLKHFETIRSYYLAGYYPGSDYTGTNFAVDIRKGSPADIEKWEKEDGNDYEVAVYKKPRATTSEALSSVYAISSLSSYPDRAMEIISLLTTNEELINLLQYGIRGTHYYYSAEKDEIVYMELADEYKMNPMYTGNNFLMHRVAGEPDTFENDKAQNLDSQVDAFFLFQPELNGIQQHILEVGNEVSKSYYDILLSGTQDFASTVSRARNALENLQVDIDYILKVDAEMAAEALELGLEYEPYEIPSSFKVVSVLNSSIFEPYVAHATGVLMELFPEEEADPEADVIEEALNK